jgi:hypothetical protein
MSITRKNYEAAILTIMKLSGSFENDDPSVDVLLTAACRTINSYVTILELEANHAKRDFESYKDTTISGKIDQP